MANDMMPSDGSYDALSRALADLVHDGSPAISAFATWALAHPNDMAFHSVRRLASLADVNVNTVYRLAVALGFSGFEDCRVAFQTALRKQGGLYGSRAARLNAGDGDDLFDRLRAASHRNLDAILDEASSARIRQASTMLRRARRVHCFGVRSCFSLAHYLTYSGRMAFENFAPPSTEPGSIADALTRTGPADVVVLISFSLYSAEVVRAHQAALSRGAQVIAITDTYASPFARDAALVFCLPMEGPQTLPSLGAGFVLVEAIVADMITNSRAAPKRIAEFEQQLIAFGSYVRATDDPAG
ncbi:MurR/RpiR family transcriptional regulator [Gymnodinialimonas sp. 2305UL16-5]|uniref:MurR/RpiR family transcriptional regulator n=1 Tax=Gymnodinialimonas mytili TaxID=3126503 RepID=UPI00309EF3BC